MQLSVQGKQIDIGESLRLHVQEKLDDLNQKFFNRAIDSTVQFSREGQGFFKAHIAIHIGKSIQIMGDATESEIYLAFDVAAAKVAKQLRKYKNRLRTHHRKLEETPETENLKAQNYVLAMEAQNHHDDAEDDGEDHPLIVAEMTSDIQTLSVAEAVMRMDLADQSVFLFRNASHNGLNIVYKRPDGHVGWVDPTDIESIRDAAE